MSFHFEHRCIVMPVGTIVVLTESCPPPHQSRNPSLQAVSQRVVAMDRPGFSRMDMILETTQDTSLNHRWYRYSL